MTLFDKYTYRQKNVALLVIAVLLGAASYKRSFKKTIETTRVINELENKKALAEQSNYEIRVLNTEISQINQMMGKENVSVEKVQQSFLNFFASHSNYLNVQEITEVYGFDHPDFRINTFRIDLKGGFISQLKFIYSLENDFHDARLIHISFNTVKNQATEKEELISTLLLQNYVQRSL